MRFGIGKVVAVAMMAAGAAVAGPPNYVINLNVDGHKMDGSHLELAAGDGKVLPVKSRKTLQLQTIEVSTDMRIPQNIKYEKLARLWVKVDYHCAAPEFHRRLSLYNYRAERWIALKRGNMEAGRNVDDAEIPRIEDYVDKRTRVVKARIYLEQTGEEPFLAKFDSFVFSGKPAKKITAHKRGEKMAGVIKKEPNMRVHQAESSGMVESAVDRLRSGFHDTPDIRRPE